MGRLADRGRSPILPGRALAMLLRLATLAGVLVVATLGMSHARAAAFRVPDLYAKPQRLVSIGPGRRMNIYCLGHGSPAVILEAGAGGSTLVWSSIQPKIAKWTKVCAYDRAGLGFSDPGPLPRVTSKTVADLKALLTAAGIPPPYVLVAHSFGSLDVRLFADTYPREVVGMVLVDPTIEFEETTVYGAAPIWEGHRKAEDAHVAACTRAAVNGELVRGTAEYRQCIEPDPHLTALLNAARAKQLENPAHWVQDNSENANQQSTSSEEVAHARRSYGSMPLIVLTARRVPSDSDIPPTEVRIVNRKWSEGHDGFAKLSTCGRNWQVANSSHFIQFDRPDLVLKAIALALRHASPASGKGRKPSEGCGF